MKKILLTLLVAISATGFSQENDSIKRSAGIQLRAGNIQGIGINLELFNKKDKKGFYSTETLNVLYTSTTVDKNGFEFTGNGFEIALSTKRYFSKEKISGFYSENSLVYGNIKFDDTDIFSNLAVDYKGKYAYWSIFSPTLGYDFIIAKKIRLNLHAGTQWQIEVKGKDDVDNKDFDNWIFKAGAKLSYDF